MTIREAIDRADTIKPNQYSDDIKMQWLSEVDNRIYNDLFMTHEDNPYLDIEPPEEGEEDQRLIFPYTDDSKTLLAEPPYDILYPSYLKAKIDEANEEMTRYQNSSAMYNSQYQDYARWYNRSHMPIQTVLRRKECYSQDSPIQDQRRIDN